MTLVLIVRHGLTSSTGKALTGWMPGVTLDDRGERQAAAVGARLAGVPLTAIVSSPLERCVQTASIIAAGQGRGGDDSASQDGVGQHGASQETASQNGAGQAAGDPAGSGPAELPGGSANGKPPDPDPPQVQLEERLGECRYGDWTGKPLKTLARDPLWRVVQAHPSAVRFPGPAGETMTGMQQRAVTALRDWNAQLGNDAVYLVCSHGDVIKAILADALGMHLDMSQRIQVDPCSLSIIRYTPLRPFVLRVNDTGADAAALAALARPPKPASKGAQGEARVGGGSGE